MNDRRLQNFAIFAVLSVALAVFACGEVDDEPTDDTAEQALTSEDGHFDGCFIPDPDPPETGDNTVTIQLAEAGGESCYDGEPVAGADIEVEPWMPGHGHGSPEEPQVTEEGEGTYFVDDVVYSMPGHWELRVDVTDGDVTDRFVVDFDVE